MTISLSQTVGTHSIREDATSVDTASGGAGDMEFWHGNDQRSVSCNKNYDNHINTYK
ncbi:MAG: hypothetical protein V7K64_32405 [Nostoc sp.]|uniref:hypothetical protein n=1 Tax=unclassified Nostoc TaxID=2593658 RepID=UPI001DA7A8C1|nr:hypothetical protein [Nostoc sp. JL34]MBN3882540.1 hypothetical protein [Nostoc sp. JL34]